MTCMNKNNKSKIAVLDWDVHHGDGTQAIFYKEQNPLFSTPAAIEKADECTQARVNAQSGQKTASRKLLLPGQPFF